MRVALLAPVAYSVPPLGYGGTEHVVATLAQALAKSGIDVTVFASGDSKPGVPCRALYPQALGHYGHAGRARYEQLEADHVMWAYRQSGEFDLIHDHTKINGACLASHAAVPVLTTVHNDLTPARQVIYGQCQDHAFVALSQAHARRMPEMPWFGIVPNGVTLPENTAPVPRGHDLLFFSRLDEQKGAHLAAQMAYAYDWPLVMAGRVSPEEYAFFDGRVAPFLDGVRRRYIGEVTGMARWQTLASVRALLFPITWSEPFGLVLVEAMACGTPVVAQGLGAIPEIVRDGVTGIVVPPGAPDACWQDAVSRVAQLQHADCVNHVASGFSAERMASRYLGLYGRLLARASGSDNRSDQVP